MRTPFRIFTVGFWTPVKAIEVKAYRQSLIDARDQVVELLDSYDGPSDCYRPFLKGQIKSFNNVIRELGDIMNDRS